MRSSGRAVVTDACQIPPYTCAAGNSTNARGALVQDQRAALQRPILFNELPATLTFRGFEPSSEPSSGGGVNFTNTSQLPSFSPVIRASFRFEGNRAPPGNVGFCRQAGPGLPRLSIPSTRSTSASGNTSISLDLRSVPLQNPAGITGTWGILAGGAPFSTQFDFRNGVGSRAGFDQEGGTPENPFIFSSFHAPAVLTFDPDAPGVTLGTVSVLPREVGQPSPVLPLGVLTEDCVDTVGQTPEEFRASVPDSALPFAAFGEPRSIGGGAYNPPPTPNQLLNPPTGVPAPGALAVLGAGLLGLLAARRRHAPAA